MNGQLGLGIWVVLSGCRLSLSLSLSFIVLILIAQNLTVRVRVLVHDPALSIGMKLVAIHVLKLLIIFCCRGLLDQHRLIIDVLIVSCCFISVLVQLHIMLHNFVCITIIYCFSGVVLALPCLSPCLLRKLHVNHLGLDLILRFSNS